MNANQYDGFPLLHSLGPPIFLFLLFVVLFAILIAVLPYWKIYSKAGFPGWLSLFMIFPVISYIILYVVAFSRWKNDPYHRPE